MKSFFAAVLLMSSLSVSGQYVSNGWCCDPSSPNFSGIFCFSIENIEYTVDAVVSDPDCPDFMAVFGCTDEAACNYDASLGANTDDGSCTFPGDACDDGDDTTINDVLGADCSCAGEAIVEVAQTKRHATTILKPLKMTELVGKQTKPTMTVQVP